MIAFLMSFWLTSHAPLSYEKDAKPIFKTRCIMCHNSSSPDRNWMDYETAKKKKDLIVKRMWKLRDMPPNNNTGITEEERKTLKQWVDDGAKK